MKHKIIFNKRWLTYDVPKYIYLCNQAVYPCGTKSSYIWKNVTCKNCLRYNKLKEGE